MDTPEISTLVPEDEEGRPSASSSTFVPYAPQAPKSPPQGTGKFRLSKIKLRLPERDATTTSGGPNHEELPQPMGADPAISVMPNDTQTHDGPPAGADAADDDEEDQLMDDDLGLGQSSPSTKPPPAKKARTRAPKHAYPGQAQVSTLLSQSSTPARAHGDHDTMMSAWQVNVSTPAPIAYASDQPPAANTGGGTNEVWDATTAPAPATATNPPVTKAPRKRAPAKPKATASASATPGQSGEAGPSAPRRRAATKKVEDLGSGAEDALPGRPLQDRNDDHPTPDIREIVDSGRYTLAPSHPLITRPFPVQPVPKGGHAYATAPPLDRTQNRARHWDLSTREIRTIGGGSWKARTWMGDEKSELATAMPPTININATRDSSPAPSSIPGTPAKHPSLKRAQGQAKPRKSSKRSKELAIAADSSDVPHTREPSVDTEMLSLMGDGDGEDIGQLSLPQASGPTAKGQYRRRMGDAEMEEFLADD